jgi:hypothetical protein
VALQFLSEWVACKTIPGLCFVLGQGSIKDHFALNCGNASCVACVTHASLMWVMSSGDQSGWGEETLSRVTFEREGTRMMLQQVTIEEHQVKNLVFVLLQLFIHIAEGHIDLVIVQRRGMDDES